jgi:pyrroline-5-carboxylate reductase
MKLQSFGFIGGGRITRLLLQALKQKNTLPEKVLVADPDEEMRTRIKAIDTALIQCVKQNIDVLKVDIVFLAVHPPIVKEIAAEISGKIATNTLVMSFIPVISIEKLSVMLGGVKKLMRMIPNAPSIMHKGYNPVAYSDNITTDEKQQLQNLFSNWGEAPEVDEQKLESFAIVTAMGPTYFWFQWLKLQKLGKQFGMSDSELIKAVPAMLHGATETLFESNLPAKDVLDLIPVCPLKEDELAIQDIFDKKLRGLYAKLSQR